MRIIVSSLSPQQIRMARASLNWSVADLSKMSEVSVSTIKRMETDMGIKSATPANLKLIRETLEAVGVEFVGGPGDGPGVRLWK